MMPPLTQGERLHHAYRLYTIFVFTHKCILDTEIKVVNLITHYGLQGRLCFFLCFFASLKNNFPTKRDMTQNNMQTH